MELFINYFLAVLLGYGVPCLIWYGLFRVRPTVWPVSNLTKPDKPKKELLVGLAGGIGILLVGQLWRLGVLIPNGVENKLLNATIWWANNLLIFSPIFIVLLIRKQSLNTVFLNGRGLPIKLIFGVIATFVGVEVYALINGGHAWGIISQGLAYNNFRNFLPVFLEGVALAFLFVRLKWVVGLKWAIGIPAALFSLAHLPRAFVNDTSLELILVDSVLTAVVTVMVFSTTARSRDVIWLGMLHYFMDIGIGAFV